MALTAAQIRASYGYPGRNIKWAAQPNAVDISSPNGIPGADDIDAGVLTHPHKRAHYQLYVSSNVESLLIAGRVWVWRGLCWGMIMEFDHFCCWEPKPYSVQGDVPLDYPERVYLEVCTVQDHVTDPAVFSCFIGVS